MKNIYFHKFCSYMYHNFRFPYPLSRIIPWNAKRDIEDWFYEHSLGIKICEKCGELKKCTISGNPYDSYEDTYNDIDVLKAYNCWYEIFKDVCCYLGFNRKSAKILWKNLSYENWEHLHQTEEEKQYGEKEWFDKFYWDVFYCSDRWSLTRLERCHWKFKQWIRMAKEV